MASGATGALLGDSRALLGHTAGETVPRATEV
jgi:hypothetical protein